ncbi:MAG TPA: cysteine peptidase family C39 domain-containing protein [Armatimonadota bacterium]|nr:cysteine peptidase family C39 domain-containing protein [Armatimonadota bacterium]
MFWDPYALPAFIVGLLLYYVGHRLFILTPAGKKRWGMGILLAILCLPALSFNLYYAHLAIEPWWYVIFRSVSGIETLAACWGMFWGFACTRITSGQASIIRVACHTIALTCTVLFIAVPFLKPIMNPVEEYHHLKNRWKGNVCLQTSGSTCGPASMATIFAFYGMTKNEREIAEACYTSYTGTELWYLLRYAKQHGLQITYLQPCRLPDIPAPALLGTTAILSDGPVQSGHFITLLGKMGNGYIIADPENGSRVLTEDQFIHIYGRLCNAISFTK